MPTHSLCRRLAATLGLLCLLIALPTTAQQVVSVEALEKLEQRVDGRIRRLAELDKELETARDGDKAALLYRRDARAIEILSLLDEIARGAVTRPEGDETRERLTKRLREDLAGVDQLIFKRLQELDARIKGTQEMADAASGAQKIGQEAYVHSLERQRIALYAALIDVLESRDALDLPVGSLDTTIKGMLYRDAEHVVALLELSGATRREVMARQALDTGNAELQSAANEVTIAHNVSIDRLKALIALQGRMEMDTTAYRAVLLRESDRISLGLFDTQALSRLLADAWSASREALTEGAPDAIFRLMVFVLLILAFRMLSRFVKRGVSAALDRSGAEMSALLKDILVSISGGTVMVFGILVALSQIGISLGPMLAGLGVAGFIVGFALQDTLGNFASGGMILIYRPYDVDDFVEVAGTSGLVKKMTLVSTTIVTFDNQTLVIPNSKIWGDVIKNVTHQRVRRVDMEFGIGLSLIHI